MQCPSAIEQCILINKTNTYRTIYHPFLPYIDPVLTACTRGICSPYTELAPANASRSTFTPQAPGSGTLCCFSSPSSRYALLPTRASASLVASAAAAAFLTASPKSDGLAENASAKAARGSTRVRDGGRARVYVYSCSRAAEMARDQSSAVAEPAPEEDSAWARAEKKMLHSLRRINVKRGQETEEQLTNIVRRWCHPFSRPPLQTRR